MYIVLARVARKRSRLIKGRSRWCFSGIPDLMIGGSNSVVDFVVRICSVEGASG